MRTQQITIPFDHPIRGEVLVKDGEVSLSKDRRTLTITGGKEGWLNARCEDTSGQPHLIAVHVTPFVPDPMVHPAGNVEAALVPGTKTAKIAWQAPKNQDKRAPIEGYVVYRKRAGDAKFRKVGQVPGKQLSYEDTNTAFDTTYVYRVATYSAKAKKPESVPSATVEIAIGRDFEFFLKAASPTVASVKVYKWHKAHWLHKTFPTKIGEEIGKVYKGHFRINGKLEKVDIDFRTGCYLTAIDPRAAAQRPGLPRPILDQRIVYRDKDGSLKDKRRSEPDVAPWERFNQNPPVAVKKNQPKQPAPDPPGTVPPEVIE